MKITGTNTYIRVEVDGKEVKIKGELVIGGFIAKRNSIICWEKPENVPISPFEKERIIKEVIEKTKDSHMVITFE